MTWVTEENDGTFTDITIPKGWVPDSCTDHTPIAGMMHVHAEDLQSVARSRGKVECNDCDAVYTLAKGWHLR